MNEERRIFSGMRPTASRPHLGNYLGALYNWVKMQNDYQCYFGIMDLHALTTNYETTESLQENIHEMTIDWLSAGLDPDKCCIFRQSAVPEHAELHLLLSMVTPLSWLERCPTYKEQLKQISTRDIATYGFLGYPVLMAADILLYQATDVPVGEDQLPHLELTREIARRFNHLYKETFILPKAQLTKFAILPGIDGRKMSKSYGNFIAMSAPLEEIEKKVKLMVTDANRIKKSDPGNPDVCSVYSYHKIFTADEADSICADCKAGSVGCKNCKEKLAASLDKLIAPIRAKRAELEESPELVDEVLQQGAEKAREKASRNLQIIKKAMNL